MIRPIRDRFSRPIRVVGTNLVYRGEFGNPNAFPRPRKELQNLPHRSLSVSRKSPAVAGQHIVSDGVEFLLFGQHTMVATQTFLAVQVTHWVEWKRPAKMVDPVTKMVIGTGLETLDTALPVAEEPGRAFEELEFTKSQLRMFTTADVREDDILDGHKVSRVVELLGGLMVELT